MHGNKYTDEEIDDHIIAMTKQFIDPKTNLQCVWVTRPTGGIYMGTCTPTSCEHCERVMTPTGRLPRKNDRASWQHWIDLLTRGEGLRKVHSLFTNHYGTCVTCEELMTSDEWLADTPE